jgi:hypothetical protein
VDEKESLNKTSCARLSDMVYNKCELLAKVHRQPENKKYRLPRDALVPERVKEKKNSIDYFKCMSCKCIYPLGASSHYLVPGGIRISYRD